MAVSTDTRHTFAQQGLPGVAADVDIFENSTSPKFAVGTRIIRADGREFVYSHFGAVAGTLSTGCMIVGQDIQESCLDMEGSSIYANASVTAISGETIKPGTSGSHYVEIIKSSVTADLYAGGYFQTVKKDGCGYTYSIRGNTASSAKTSGANQTFYLELVEPLQQTLATVQTTSFRIVGNRYANLESCTAATNFYVAGITTCSHPATATYGWVQTRGFGGVRTEATTIAAGYVFTISLAEPGLASYNLGNCSAVSGQVRFQRPILGSIVASAIASTQDQLVACAINIV